MNMKEVENMTNGETLGLIISIHTSHRRGDKNSVAHGKRKRKEEKQ